MSFSVELIKTANESPVANKRRELERVMDSIYNESPWKWPNGLSINSHDEIYMIREASTKKAVGFTGWQERMDGMDKVGFYTIGVLPEFRGHGLAKEAVAKLITKKASKVDRIKAMIVSGNMESVGLSDALGVAHDLVKRASAVQMIKSAENPLSWGARHPRSLMSIIGVGSGLANATAWDEASHSDEPWANTFHFGDYDKKRQLMFGLNTLLGAGGGLGIQKGMKMMREHPIAGPMMVTGGIGGFAMSGAKDLVQQTLPLPSRITKTLDIIDAKNKAPSLPNVPGMSVGQKIGLGLLGVAGLGAGAYGVNHLANAVHENTENNARARVKVTLPTKDPNDAETTVEAPLSDLGLSDKIDNEIGRDTRRRLRGEISERTIHRGPKQEVEQVKVAAMAPKADQMPQNPTRTPWAASYAQAQLPPAPPDEDLLKKVEDAHKKIDNLAHQMRQNVQEVKSGQADQLAKATPVGNQSGQTYFASQAALNSHINTALKLVGASRVKSANAVPVTATRQPVTPKPKPLPPTVGMLQGSADLADRTFQGQKGIQTSFYPKTVPFGEMAHRLGSYGYQAAFGSPMASARATFQDRPQQTSIPQQLMMLSPQLLNQYNMVS